MSSPHPPVLGRWSRIETLFDAALARAPAERAAFLAEACRDDSTLRGEVETLVRAHDEAGTFLERPAALPPPAGDEPPLAGRSLGPYRLDALIGTGGMGDVYLAHREDAAPPAPVAVKLVKSQLGSPAVLRRFRSEVRILAALDHPHIARLLDSGAIEDGRPYLVMEYADGAPIDAYCRDRHLGVADRLRLFRQVCAAVDHAHRCHVVHRDLKPGNILVTRAGAPMLVDFGIAKLLDPAPSGAQADSTVRALGMMTPDYASPEQVLGQPVTPRSDVYSLGVVLYELVSGERPRRLAGLATQQVVSALAETEVPSLREAARRSHGPRIAADLDWIVLKALRSDPDDRYASAEHLSADLGRHLAGLPVRTRRERLAAGLDRLRRRFSGA